MKFKKIYIEITNKCNLNCSFCSKDNRIFKEMTIDQFEIILKKIQEYTKTIYLHVKGEPLLHSKLENILKLSNDYNFNVKITTNGTLLKKKMETLNKFNNIKQINISLHSENNKKNFFQDVFYYSNLLSKKIPIVYRIWTLNNDILDESSTIIIDKIINYYKLDNNFKNKVINENNIKIKDNIYLDKDNKFIWPDNLKQSNNINGTCLGTRSHIGILVDGTVIPCCLDSKGILKLGNIFKNNLDDITNSSLFKNINQGFRNNKIISNLCRNCIFRKQKFK